MHKKSKIYDKFFASLSELTIKIGKGNLDLVHFVIKCCLYLLLKIIEKLDHPTGARNRKTFP